MNEDLQQRITQALKNPQNMGLGLRLPLAAW
jgi:hypothetical protein